MKRIGIVGAGTMGSGIALATLLADFQVTLVEVSPEVSQRAQEYIETFLNRKRKAISLKYMTQTSVLEDLSGCEVVIEAVPEDLGIKQDLIRRLDFICPPPALLATNTSTLSVTAIASASRWPERIAGMHFFNPAPVMPLVEVVRGFRTHETTIQSLVNLAERLGKKPVIASDTPGFIVNRVARPFYGEALRLLGEGAASHEQIDWIVREGGGFRMGPFELMDLIGIDINFAATQSIYEQTFHEPRYRPHPIQARMVAQGTLGRKSGQGFYTYTDGEIDRDKFEVLPLLAGPPEKDIILVAPGSWAPGLLELCRAAGYVPLEPGPVALENHSFEQMEAGLVEAGRSEGLREQVQALDQVLPPEIPLLCSCAEITLAEVAAWVRHRQRLVGFDGLFLATGKIATLTGSPEIEAEVKARAAAFFARLGRPPVWVQDAPGLVLPRIIAMLANEAAFAVGEGVAPAETIDLAMQIGTNYPFGPLSWAIQIGYAHVVAVLEALQREYGEERYRVAPWLRRQARWG